MLTLSGEAWQSVVKHDQSKASMTKGRHGIMKNLSFILERLQNDLCQKQYLCYEHGITFLNIETILAVV